MKLLKYLTLVFSLMLVTACSSLKIETKEVEQLLDNKYEHMIKVSELELTEIYGIDLKEFKQYSFKRSYDDPTNIYVFILPTKSKRKAKKEVNKFFDYLEKYENETNKKRIKKRYVDNIDDYLVFLVSDNNKDIYKELKETLEKDNK